MRKVDVREHSPGTRRKIPKEKFPKGKGRPADGKKPGKKITKGPTKKRRKSKKDPKDKKGRKKHPSKRDPQDSATGSDPEEVTDGEPDALDDPEAKKRKKKRKSKAPRDGSGNEAPDVSDSEDSQGQPSQGEEVDDD